MTPFRLLWLHLRIGIMSELEYRANFSVQVFQTLVALAIAVGRLGVIFCHTDELGGSGPNQMLALTGVFFLVLGVVNLIIQPSMQRVLEDVRRGTLDFVLTKPEDAQLLINVRQIEIWKVVAVLMGLGLIAVALYRLRESIGVMEATGFGLTLLAGLAIVYSFLLLLTSASFWFVRVENLLVIFQSMYEAGRWPVGLYPGWLQRRVGLIREPQPRQLILSPAATQPRPADASRCDSTTFDEAESVLPFAEHQPCPPDSGSVLGSLLRPRTLQDNQVLG